MINLIHLMYTLEISILVAFSVKILAFVAVKKYCIHRKNLLDHQAMAEMETRHYNIERRNKQVVLPSSSDVSTVGLVISTSWLLIGHYCQVMQFHWSSIYVLLKKILLRKNKNNGKKKYT